MKEGKGGENYTGHKIDSHVASEGKKEGFLS